jgi:predicted nucleotide-binding protein
VGAGVFLFTRDDKVADETDANKAVPRDNVVFEAGYFSHAKGRNAF